MMTIKHIKIFDMRNPNCTFANIPTPEMFKNVPVIVWNKDEMECMHESVIGIISDVDSIVYLGSEIYGDVVIFFKGEDVNVEFVNYEVCGECVDDKRFRIDGVNAVVVREKI